MANMEKSKFKSHSIKIKLILWQIILVIIICVAIGVISFFIVRQYIRSIQIERLHATTQAVAVLSRSFIQERRDQLITIAKSDAARKYHKGHNPLILQYHFSRYISQFPIISYVSEEGMEEVKNVNGAVSFNYINLSDSLFFQDTIQTPNKVHLGPPRYSGLIDAYVLDFGFLHVNYFDENMGFFKGSIPISHLSDQLEQLKISESGFFIIISPKGYVVTSPKEARIESSFYENRGISKKLVHRIKSQDSIFGEEYQVFGQDSIISMMTIEKYNWKVISVIPEDEIFAVLYKLRNNIGLITILILIFGALLTYLVAKSVSDPIKDLDDFVSSISASKDLSLRADLKSSDEIGRLANSFNQMLEQLESAQSEIIKTKNFLDNVIKTMSDFLVVVNSKGDIIVANKAFLDFVDIKESDISGENLSTFLIADRGESILQDKINELFTLGTIKNIEQNYLSAEGKTLPLSISASVMRNAAGEIEGVVVIAHDITERKQAEEKRSRLEEELQQSQKMEALGTLTGGIAHDFNNILGSLLGYTEIALGEVDDKSQTKTYLVRIAKIADRAKKLVQQMLTFSRAKKPDLKPLKLEPVILESIYMLRSVIPTTIEIRQEIDADCSPILGDETQINQVVVNLCTNAFHSMEDTGGTITIQLQKVDITNQNGSNIKLKSNDYIKLTVKDSGVGMEPKLIKSIFDPFFSTKEPGKGTGLGLSVVQGIVHGHGGVINCESIPGKGSTFDLYFPLYVGKVTAETTEKMTVKPGNENILVLDDEVEFAKILDIGLKKMGYQVTTFNDVHLALKEFMAHPKQFDLVITDLTMPKMSGVEFSQEILKARSDLPIILISGYDTNTAIENAKEIGIKRVVTKPLKLKQLSNTIRDIFYKNTN